MKGFVSKYKQNQFQTSQSSIGQFSSQPSNGFTFNNQFQKGKDQQNQLKNVNNNPGSQTFQSQNLMANQIQIENKNSLLNNSFKQCQKIPILSSQQNHISTQMQHSDINDNFNVRNQNKNQNNSSYISQDSVQNQRYNNLSHPHSNFQQTQSVLVPAHKNMDSYGRSLNIQSINPEQQKSQINNLAQNQIQQLQNLQRQQLANAHAKILYDEIQKAKMEQKQIETQLKQELLQEIKGIKSYFIENVMNELDNELTQRDQTLYQYSQHLDELVQKVESMVQTVFTYLKDSKPCITNKQKIRQSEFAQTISDLYQIVSQIKQNILEQPDMISEKISSDLNLATQIIFSKINQAKKSVKKQVCQISKSPLKRGRKLKIM